LKYILSERKRWISENPPYPMQNQEEKVEWEVARGWRGKNGEIDIDGMTDEGGNESEIRRGCVETQSTKIKSARE
jgi:hypothetical protein